MIYLDQDRGQYQPGDVILHRYAVKEYLGTGSSGSVYACLDTDVGSLMLAIKVIPAHLAAGRIAAARLHREIRASYRVKHDHVISLYDCAYDSDKIVLVMEYADGGTLADLMDRTGTVSSKKTVGILGQLCSGLHAVHEAGIVHRDLKPANVLLTGDGIAKISDFGISAFQTAAPGHYSEAVDLEADNSQIKDNTRLTRSDTMVGTPEYLSPEYIESGKIDKRSDIYALGVIAYEMICGVLPFKAASMPALIYAKTRTSPLPPLKVNPGCAPGLSVAILKALKRDPDRRYQTVSEFAADIAKLRNEFEKKPHTQPDLKRDGRRKFSLPQMPARTKLLCSTADRLVYFQDLWQPWQHTVKTLGNLQNMHPGRDSLKGLAAMFLITAVFCLALLLAVGPSRELKGVLNWIGSNVWGSKGEPFSTSESFRFYGPKKSKSHLITSVEEAKSSR